MKKLLVGIVAVALLGLLAVPAMAVELDTADVGVEITVLQYGAIVLSTLLEFTVAAPLTADPTPLPYCDEITFNVLCNTNSTLTVTADLTTVALYDPGKGNWYPTATGATDEAVGHWIGYGVRVGNLTPPVVYGAWIETETQANARAEVSFSPSLTADPDPNASLYVVSYMDSAKDGDALAPAGRYDATLTLTLNTT